MLIHIFTPITHESITYHTRPWNAAEVPIGESDNWNKGKANHMRIGSLFLAHVHETDAVLSEKCGLVWEEEPEKQAASFHVFAMRHRTL